MRYHARVVASAGGQTLKWMWKNRSRTAEQLAAHNLDRFRENLAWTVERSPYYAGICREHGIDPRSARPEDLPILTKRELIANFDTICSNCRKLP